MKDIFGTEVYNQVIAFRCDCTFITSISQSWCWSCKKERTANMQLLKGSDFGPTGAVKPEVIEQLNRLQNG